MFAKHIERYRFFPKVESFVDERIGLNTRILLAHPPLHVLVKFVSIVIFPTTLLLRRQVILNNETCSSTGFSNIFRITNTATANDVCRYGWCGGPRGDAGRLGTCSVVNRGSRWERFENHQHKHIALPLGCGAPRPSTVVRKYFFSSKKG